MASKTEFPAHPFWDYSLKLYARPGVADACIVLQDEFDLDVNLILFCIWAGAEGPGRLTAEELAESRNRSNRWQGEVVQRLRNIRRTLKVDSLGATTELVARFRPKAQALELDAEHVEQLLLAGLVPQERGDNGVESATGNLRAYLELAGIAPQGNSRPSVLFILENAFPGLSRAGIAAGWSS